MKRTLTRRGFLRTAGAALLGASAAASGCAPGPRVSFASSRMNVVLVIIDSLRKDHVGAYGNPWIKTPNLDALARESLRFTRAHPESMPTIPARRAIHTGRRSWPFDVYRSLGRRPRDEGWHRIPEDQRTLAEILQHEGYETSLVTDTYVQFPMNFGRGFDAYRKIRGQEYDPYRPTFLVSQRERDRYMPNQDRKAWQYLANTRGRETEEDWLAPQVFLGASEALEEVRRREPFFLVADCYDPHEPWDPPGKYTSLYDPDGYEGKEPLASDYGPADWITDEQLKRMKALYAGEVTMADRWLGHFLDKMDELGLFDNTLLVLLSDHGHLLGEHGYTGKPYYALWPELTDIVFFVRHPEGKGAGEASDFFASTHDVAPTVLSVLGVPSIEPMDGQDLSVLLDGAEPEPRPYATSAYGNFVWARDDSHVMFSREDGAKARLYDVRTDPGQRDDLAPENPGLVEKMFEDYVLGAAGTPLPLL